MNRAWWKESVVYQIYPRSFKDTTGNGLGDIYGIIEKLDYIKALNVDVVWICPVYESPNNDNGYDISDYRTISEEFGGNSAFDLLLKKMHDKGLKLVMDLVANHTSDQHEWFQQAKKTKTNPYRDYYHWKSSKNGEAPNNWQSIFGGTVWSHNETTNDFYLHLFTKEQPDLNWENPKVRQEIYDVVRFWANKGVDGFRMDVISLISKQKEFPNTIYDNYQDTIKNYYANGPKIHEYLQEMNKEVLSKYDLMTVGEGPGIDLDNGLDYVHHDRGELNMVFHFDHMFIDAGPKGKYDIVDFDLNDFKSVFNQWDQLLKQGGWGSIFLGNHDFSRMVSRFGNDKKFHKRSAKALAMLLLTLRGTVYIYQGDEIGMTNVAYPSINDYNDVETLQAWQEAQMNGEDMDVFLKKVHLQSRDNARTPMQWDKSLHAGFSNSKPWLTVNSNYKTINVKSQDNDPLSILNFYRDMILFRKENLCLVYGDYECLDEHHQQIFAYRRNDGQREFLVVHNMSCDPITWRSTVNHHQYTLLKTNTESTQIGFEFEPWQSKIFIKT
ncbi:MAG: alpha-glucosidase [Psychroserpens sp.]|uniref:alpha-glucosidase n=1 Tax=Psychroserpens sp. TaxID=2020870 RepID=UPI003C9583D9